MTEYTRDDEDDRPSKRVPRGYPDDCIKFNCNDKFFVVVDVHSREVIDVKQAKYLKQNWGYDELPRLNMKFPGIGKRVTAAVIVTAIILKG